MQQAKTQVRLRGGILTQPENVRARIEAKVKKEAELAAKNPRRQRLMFHKIRKGIIPIKIRVGKSGRVIAFIQPTTHGITGTRNGAYLDLISILKEGFKGRKEKGSDNTSVSLCRLRRGLKTSPEIKNPSLAGDSYSIETVAPLASVQSGLHLKKAAPSEIISVNIAINPNTGKEETEERKRFYKEKIQKEMGFPVKFIYTELKP